MRGAPGLRVAGGIALGITVADALSAPAIPVILLILFALLLATFAGAAKGGTRAQSWRRPVVVLAITAACGICGYGRVVHRDGLGWARMLTREMPVEIVGRVTGGSASSQDRLILSDLLLLPSGEKLAGKILVYLDRGSGLQKTSRGAHISVVGDLHALPRKRNPSDFDYGNYLRRRGIRAILYAHQSAAFVFELPPPFARAIGATRLKIRHVIAATVHDRDAQSILSAMLLGDRSGIDARTRTDFTTSGLVHLLAVSGLHVMVIGFVFFNIAGPLLRRARLSWTAVELIRAPTTILLLLAYMAITGCPDSVVRAVIMASTLIASPLFRRSSRSLNTLYVAAAVILSLTPWSLFDVGFQLSVAAVAAILTINPVLHASYVASYARKWLGERLVSNVTVTMSVTVGVAPVLLHHFGVVSLGGLIMNVPAIPLTAAALVSGTLASAVGPEGPAAAFYGQASQVCLNGVIWLARLGGRHLAGFAISGFPSPPTLAGICLAAAAAAHWRRPARWILLAAALTSVAAGRWTHVVDKLRVRTDILFFDVGQGDAILLTTASGRSILVDTGDARGRSNSAVRSIEPHLRRRNIDKIDLLVLTHAHSDHIGGAPHVIGELLVKRIVYNGTPATSRILNHIKALADSTGVVLRSVAAGDTLLIDPSLTVQVLWPPHGNYAMSENNRSVVLRIGTVAGAVLLTGDVEKEGEARIAAVFGPLLSSRIVKVPHHGSSTSSSLQLLTSIVASRQEDSIAIVSVAESNAYGLPDPSVLEHWKERGFQVMETRHDGAVAFSLTRFGLRRDRWQKDKPN